MTVHKCTLRRALTSGRFVFHTTLMDVSCSVDKRRHPVTVTAEGNGRILMTALLAAVRLFIHLKIHFICSQRRVMVSVLGQDAHVHTGTKM